MTDTANRNVLIIGGHGKVAQLATPRLVAAGHDVTSLIRSPEQVPDIEALGSTPQVRDLTALRVEDWVELVQDMDVVIWSAGNGGRDGSSATYAIDRDGALALIDALTQLGEDAPRLVAMVLTEMAGRDSLPQEKILPFVDADGGADAAQRGVEKL